MTDQLPQKPLAVPIPANEAERLAALHRYKILDTPPEATFDRITRLAARLFEMPTALISLVTDEALIISDTRLNDLFACNPFVQFPVCS